MEPEQVHEHPNTSVQQDYQPRKWSVHFQHSDSDITFCSKDNFFFSIHRKNVETHSLGFPPSEFESNGETVSLPEDGRTLELLFRFMYPSPELPNLDELPFEPIVSLAEAAEKYDVSMLIYICRRRMRDFILDHPQQVLEFACKHDYPEMLDDIIPNMLKKPPAEIASIASSRYLLAWIQYIKNWNDISVSLARDIKDKNYCHGEMGRRLMHTFSRLGDLNRLRDIDGVFDFSDVEDCCEQLGLGTSQWMAFVKAETENLPKFTTLLGQ